MTHKLKTEEFFLQKIEYSGDVLFWPLTPLFSFVSFHLKYRLLGSKLHGAVSLMNRFLEVRNFQISWKMINRLSLILLGLCRSVNIKFLNIRILSRE